MAEGDIFKDFTAPLIMESKRLRGGIKRILALPCSLPVEVYVETLVPATLRAFWTIIEPDAKEVYHKVSGKSFVCDLTASAEKAYKFTGGPENKVTRFLFKSLALYDIATWWFFLADVAVEGVANWTSFAYAQRECNAKGDPRYGSGPLWAGSCYHDGRYNEADYQFAPPSQFAPVSSTFIFLKPRQSGTIAVNAQYKIPGGVPVATTCRIAVEGTGIILDEDWNGQDAEVSNRPNRVWSHYKNNTGEVTVMSASWAWPGPGGTAQCFADPETAHCTMIGPPV